MSPRRRAINYYIGTLVRDQLRRVGSNPVQRQVDRARQVRMTISSRRKNLDEEKVILAIDLLFQLSLLIVFVIIIPLVRRSKSNSKYERAVNIRSVHGFAEACHGFLGGARSSLRVTFSQLKI